MAEAYGPTRCPFSHAFESELSRRPKVHHGFVPKLSHHSGKNTVPLRSTEKTCPLEYCWLESLLPTSGTFFSAERGGVERTVSRKYLDGDSCAKTG